jgi:hypothetical protein
MPATHSRNSPSNPTNSGMPQSRFAASESSLRDLDSLTAVGEDAFVRIVGRVMIIEFCL